MKALFLFLFIVSLTLSKAFAQTIILQNSNDVTWAKTPSGKTTYYKANVLSSSIGNSLGIAAIKDSIKKALTLITAIKTSTAASATIVKFDSTTLYKLLQIQRTEIDQLKARSVINADSLNKVIIAQTELIKTLKLRLDTQKLPALDTAAVKGLLKKYLVKQKADTIDIPKVPYKVILTPYDAGL